MNQSIHYRSIVLIALVTLVVSGSALGWGGPTHSALASREYSDSGVSALVNQYLTSSQKSTITAFTGEPPETYHHPAPYGSWPGLFQGRHYLSDPLWLNLDEATRLKYLTHMSNDTGVPVGHAPANMVYTDFWTELFMEARVSLWESYPNVSGSSYSGTYLEVCNAHQVAVVANATAYKAGADENDVVWAATAHSQKFSRAFLADYFLAKKATIANANGSYAVNPGGSAAFSSAGSQDPDSITWNSNATYYNNGGGMTISWDLNNDGTYETAGASPSLTYAELLSLVGPTEGKTINLRVADTDPGVSNSISYDIATVAVYADPIASSANYSIVPGENLMLNGVGSDPDGGSIVSWAWDLDGDGEYDDLLTEDGSLSYLDLYNMGLDWLSIHTIGLKVIDNEGAEAFTTALLSMGTPVTADFNLDGIVNGGDFLIWNGGYGTPMADWIDGDANGDGIVNGQDFLIWNANYGDTSSAPRSTPEPASLVLLALGGMAILRRRRK